MSYPVVKAAIGDREDVLAGQWALAVVFVLYFVVFFAADAGMLAF